jgi:hypothetical protein
MDQFEMFSKLMRRAIRRGKSGVGEIRYLLRDKFCSRFPSPKKSSLKCLESPNPIIFPNRKYSGTLKLVIRGCGLKDKIFTFLAPSIAYCLENDFYLSWDGDLGAYGYWQDYFEPFAEQIEESQPTFEFLPDWGAPNSIFRHIAYRYSPVLVRKIWNYNSHTASAIRMKLTELTSNRSYFSIQIRRGDKMRFGAIQSIPAHKILEKIPNQMALAVSTDDYSVIEELLDLRPGLTVITTCRPFHRGSDGSQNHFQANEISSQKEETLRLLTDLELCISSSTFLRVKPPFTLNRDGFSRNYQISDMISVLRNEANEILIV